MNFDKLVTVIKESWGEVVSEINEEYDAVISDEMAFSDLGFTNQDIIDSGRLLVSKQVNVSENKAFFTWNPQSPETGYPYAKAVREGFFAYGGSKYIPGRRWDERAHQRVNPVQSLADKLESKGLKVKITQNDIF